LTLRVVVDTNVSCPGLLNAEGPPARVLDLVRDGDVTLLVDDRILEDPARAGLRLSWTSSLIWVSRSELGRWTWSCRIPMMLPFSKSPWRAAHTPSSPAT
jgi:hypothetical protein